MSEIHPNAKGGGQERSKRSKGAGSGGHTSGDGKVVFRGFVNYDPILADVEPFRTFSSDPDHVAACLDTAIAQGYKFSLSYDRRADCFVATLYANFEGLPAPGYALSQRSKDRDRATCKVLYVHFGVFAQVWPIGGVQERNDPLG